MMRGIRVAVVGTGSFNPPTYMHMRMFELAHDYLTKICGAIVLEGIISAVSDGYGKPGLANGQHRLRMCQYASQNNKWIRVDPFETEQAEWKPTLMTLRRIRSDLKQKYGCVCTPSSSGCSNDNTIFASNQTELTEQNELNFCDKCPRLMLLCGGDLLQSFLVPNLWSSDDLYEILTQFGLVVLKRSGVDCEVRIYESPVLRRHRSEIHIIEDWINPNDCSSTKIRDAIRKGFSIRYLVNDDVLDYIEKNHLYKYCDADVEGPGSSSKATIGNITHYIPPAQRVFLTRKYSQDCTCKPLKPTNPIIREPRKLNCINNFSAPSSRMLSKLNDVKLMDHAGSNTRPHLEIEFRRRTISTENLANSTMMIDLASITAARFADPMTSSTYSYQEAERKSRMMEQARQSVDLATKARSVSGDRTAFDQPRTPPIIAHQNVALCLPINAVDKDRRTISISQPCLSNKVQMKMTDYSFISQPETTV